MDPWRCCRMCLSNSDLNPIFLVQEHHEKYSDVLFAVTGVKVSTTDRLSQLICTNCVNITNESYKYRKKAQETQQILTENLLNAPENEIKLENKVLNTEKYITIDISDLVDNFHDFEDATSNFSENIDKNTEILTENKQNKTLIEDKSLKKDKVKRKVKRKAKKASDDVKTNEVLKTGDVPKTNEVPEMKEVTNVSVETKGSEKKGERIKEAIECQYCHKILTSKLSLRNHYKIHTGFDIVCEHCGKKFITRRLLLMHCKAKHGYEKTDKCSYCDYKASNAEQVKIHERLHTGEKPYVCGECGAGFHRKSSYLQHVAIHLPEKTVECEVCGAGFKSVTLMRIHLSRHRAPRHVFSCRECGLTFARRRNVARHLQRIHALRPDDAYIARTQCG